MNLTTTRWISCGTLALMVGSLTVALNARAQSRDGGVAAAPPVVARDAGATAVAVPVVPAVPEVSPFEGTWRYSGGEPQRQALETAITRTVQGMGFFIEGIAAGRLRDRAPISPTITVHVANGQIEYTAHNRRLYRTPTNGTPVQTQNPWGDAITLRTTLNGSVLTRAGQFEQGSRHEVIRVQNNTLTVHTTIASPRLPRPMVYQLTYQR